MREILSMFIVLSVICGASGFALSYLKVKTEPIIEEQVLTFVQGPAIRTVYPEASNDPIGERKQFATKSGTVTVFPYKQGDKLIGVALESKGAGYGGDIGVMVGFDTARDVLLGIKVTSMKETPGLGTLIDAPKFSGQFKNSSFAVNLKAKGGQIDAVSGATISSQGAVTAVQDAAATYQELKAQILAAWQ